MVGDEVCRREQQGQRNADEIIPGQRRGLEKTRAVKIFAHSRNRGIANRHEMRRDNAEQLAGAGEFLMAQ